MLDNNNNDITYENFWSRTNILLEGSFHKMYSKKSKNEWEIIIKNGTNRAHDLLTRVLGTKLAKYVNSINELCHLLINRSTFQEAKTKLFVWEKDPKFVYYLLFYNLFFFNIQTSYFA